MAIPTHIEFVGWNMRRQMAIDADDNVWAVDGWFDSDGDEIPIDLINWHGWDEVEIVTVFCDMDSNRVWSSIRPDDFTGKGN